MVEETKVLKDEEKNIQIEDDKRLNEILKRYRVLYLSDDNFIKRLFNIDSIRIYDKTILKIKEIGDKEFVKERNRLLKDSNYLTYNEQLKILEERGIWSNAHENRIEELKDIAKELEEKKDKILSKFETNPEDKKIKKELEKIKSEIVNTHNELLELLAFQYNFFRDTIEMRAQIRQQMGWIVGAVCLNEGDDKYDESKRLWKSVEDFEKDLNENDFTILLNECNSFWNSIEGGGESFFGESPEDLI